MSVHELPLSEMQWEQGAHPLEQKKACLDGHLVQLRFAPGFADPSWCERGHTLIVQQGTLHVRLSDEVVEVRAGDALVLTQGTAHKAENRGDVPVTLLAIQHQIAP